MEVSIVDAEVNPLCDTVAINLLSFTEGSHILLPGQLVLDGILEYKLMRSIAYVLSSSI